MASSHGQEELLSPNPMNSVEKNSIGNMCAISGEVSMDILAVQITLDQFH